MKLTDTAVRNAKPCDSKNRKLNDGRGLYLEMTPKGGKRWRFRYQFAGKEKCISMGVYPDVSLKYAREQRETARELLAKGIDPSEQRRVDKIQKTESNGDTFQAIAEAWFEFESRKMEWVKGHQVRVRRMMEKYLYPWVGQIPIAEITTPQLRAALHKIEEQGKYDTAKRARQVAGAICSYATVTGKVEHDIGPNVKQVVLKPPKPKHRAAIIEPLDVGKLMLSIDAYKGSPEVSHALRLAPLTFVRPGELRHAEWSEIDLDGATWTIKGEKMKMREDHIIPLSRQSLEILRNIKRFTGSYDYVFPSGRTPTRPISDNAILVALRTMGYAKDQMTGHGFRAMARTLLDEELNFEVRWIELQLAHTVPDAHGRAYNRALYLKERRVMMQKWADYLDDLRAKVVAN